MSTGTTIKKLREQSGMTQEELAARLGMKKAAINKYETGRVVNLKRSTIEQLCRIFNVLPQDLLGISDDGEAPAPCALNASLCPSNDENLMEFIRLLDKKKQIELRDYLDEVIGKDEE